MSNYPFFVIGCSKLCTYCGDPATQLDHVIPVAFQTCLIKPKRRSTAFGPVAHCCASCNSILASRVFDTFHDRCREVSHKLNERTKAVEWSKEEMEKLDGSLKGYIEREQARRLWMRYRTDWFESRDYLLNIEPITWEACLDKESKLFHQELFNYFEMTLIWLKTLSWKRLD